MRNGDRRRLTAETQSARSDELIIKISSELCELCASAVQSLSSALCDLVPAHALIPAAGSEDFAEPVAAQLRVELAIDHHRSTALIEPWPQLFKVTHVADRDSVGAH